MAKRKRVLSGLGAAGKRRKRRKSSSKKAKGAFKVVAKSTGLKKSGRLRKGCKWGRGKNRGKVLCRKAA